MGNFINRQLSNTGSSAPNSPGRLRRKLTIRQKSRPSKMAKTEVECKELDAVPAGDKFAPSHSNFYSSMCIRINDGYEEDVCFFEWIPIEVIAHCLSFMSLEDIYRASLINKTFYKAATDILLWKTLCYRDLKITQKWATKSWMEYYRMVRCITWDSENCCPNEFQFTDHHKTITKVTSYGVATARSKHLFVPSGRKYVFEVKINFRRPNFFYGVGFIDKDIMFNFNKASYPKADSLNTEVQEKKYELQWFYWSDGNCWDILGSHPVSSKSRTFVSKKGIERKDQQNSVPNLAFYTGDTLGIVLDYTASPQPLLTFFLNSQKAHQFQLPKPMELYLSVYFYNANDSVSIQHCESGKYDELVYPKEV